MCRTSVIRVELSDDGVVWCSPAMGSSTGVADWGNGGGVEGHSPSRLSDAVPSLFTPSSFIVQGSGLRCGPHLLCLLLTSARQFSSGFPLPSSGLPRNTLQISRGKTRILPRIDAGFTKCTLVDVATDAVDGGLDGHVPVGPECITPHIRFLFIVPRFRLGLPPHPASRQRTCPLANLRLYTYLVSGLSPDWIRAMHGTHVLVSGGPPRCVIVARCFQPVRST